MSYDPSATKRGAEFDAHLADLWASGAPVSEIADRLGVTVGVIVGRRRRIGLPTRGTPVGAEAAAKRRAVKLAAAEANRKHEKRAAEKRIMIRKIAAHVPPPLRCQWVDGDHLHWTHCDKPVVRGSYCAEHAARCYLTRSEFMASKDRAA